MRLNQKSFFLPLILFFLTYILVYISLFVIKNPDQYNYLIIMNSSTEFSLSIEPTVYLFSKIAKYFSGLFFIDPLVIFYSIYIFLIQFFLAHSFLNFFKNSIGKSIFLLIFWMMTYGLMHGLIQIRFGLASSIFVYLYSVYYLNPAGVRNIIFKLVPISFLAIFSHYSSIFSVFSLLFIWLRKSINNISSGKIIHIVFIVILVMFKFGSIFSFLPEFLMSRIGIYLNNDNYDEVSNIARYISFICYVFLILSPKLNSEKLNDLRIYGALGFIPYFIIPELEILVRLGIPFQYLLLPYLFLTLKFKKVLYFSTLPLGVFFSYKIYSSVNAFLGYLN
ncbi:EpsG family protein [Acinetobacter junii]|uniref:EpsG family protein n=1 Tax=Acinetobacter junii TaxID=40215 RepID=UPI00124C415D|nr:EpsG family protein [Acinetobacter junii]